jgi:hypothetical protein
LARAFYASILEKIALVWQNVDTSRSGLRRSRLFEFYTPDKKRDISYNLGMSIAKFNAEKLLGIDNLIHVVGLKKQGAITFVTGVAQEPDLVGLDKTGNWHVFEAKGRSANRSALNLALSEAKIQANAVHLINGLSPTTRSVSATYIGPKEIFSIVEDPPSSDGRELEIEYEAFVRAYYSPYFLLSKIPDLSRKQSIVGGRSFDQFVIPVRSTTLGVSRLTFGLATEIVGAIERDEFHAIRSILQDLSRTHEVGQDSNFSFGADGFIAGEAPFSDKSRTGKSSSKVGAE